MPTNFVNLDPIRAHIIVGLIGHVGCHVISGTYIFAEVSVPSTVSNNSITTIQHIL